MIGGTKKDKPPTRVRTQFKIIELQSFIKSSDSNSIKNKFATIQISARLTNLTLLLFLSNKKSSSNYKS